MAVFRMLFICVAALLAVALSAPTPGDKHVKYIIHVPIKYHTIHHVKVEKVPIHVKKHVHHHKHVDHHDGYDRGDLDLLDGGYDFSH